MRKLIDISPLIRKRPYISPQVSFEEEELENLMQTATGGTYDTDKGEDSEGQGMNDGFAKESSIFDDSDFEFSVDLGE